MSAERNVFVQLFTRLGEQYTAPATSFNVKSTSTDRTLNEILNSALAAAGKTGAAFDFLIGGALVRGQIGAYLGAGGEAKAQVEYVLGVGEPAEAARAAAPRAVARLFATKEGCLAGCFDGTVEWRDAALAVTAEADCADFAEPLQRAVLAYDFAETANGLAVYAGGAWSELFAARFEGGAPRRLRADAECAIAALVASPFADVLWVGDCRGALSLYTAEKLQRTASLQLMNSAVTAMKIFDESRLLVAARDDLLKLVDVSSLITLASFAASDAPVTACESLARAGLCFSGHATGTLRLFDAREPGAPRKVLKAHSQLVSQIAFNPNSANQFASACYGGVIAVWDLRSDRALYEIDSAAQRKIYSLVWDGAGRLLSAGEDDSVVAHCFN